MATLQRCCNCDYLGDRAIYNTEEDVYECPKCGDECFDFEEMTIEEEDAVEKFF